MRRGSGLAVIGRANFSKLLQLRAATAISHGLVCSLFAVFMAGALLSMVAMPALAYPDSANSASRPGSLAGIDSGRVLDALSQSVEPVSVRKRVRAVSDAPVKPAGRIFDLIGRRPFAFVENRGQYDARVKFRASRGEGAVWVTRDSMIFDLAAPAPAALHPVAFAPGSSAGADSRRARFSERLEGIDPSARLAGEMPSGGRYNFIRGAERSQWTRGARAYRLLTWRGAWKGVNLRLYQTGRDLEQEFVVMPGADAARIRIALDGVKALTVARDGSLVIATAIGELRQRKPFAYQNLNGSRVEVPARFELRSDRSYTFTIGHYRHDRPLVIDPALLYGTYLGGVHGEAGWAIATDSAGNAYVAGNTDSQDFPVSANAFQTQRDGSNNLCCADNAFVSKFGPSGALLYSTYLGGNATTHASGIAVDAQGDAYVVGSTAGQFPTTANAFQQSFGGGSDAFVTELSPDGSALIYSTYLGGAGNEGAIGIAIDQQGGIYVDGTAKDPGFPTTAGVFQPNNKGADNGFVAKLDTTQSGAASLLWSTYIGGSGSSSLGGAIGIAVDGNGHPFVVGQAASQSFPTTAGVFQKAFAGGAADGFVAELASDASSIIWASYLGGSKDTVSPGEIDAGNDYCTRIALDGSGNAYVVGVTGSSDFPVAGNVVQKSYAGGDSDMFVAKIGPGGTSLLFSSFLGGSDSETGFPGIARDSAANIWIAGLTRSTDYKQLAPIQTPGGAMDAVVTELNPGASAYLMSSYIGGSGSDQGLDLAIDSFDNVWLTGSTESSDFKSITDNAFQADFGGDSSEQGTGGGDAFVLELGTGAIASVQPSSGGNAGSVTVVLTGAGFEDGAQVSLKGAGQTINAALVSALVPAALAASFDLSGAPAGVYDVNVANPDGTMLTVKKGFTVTDGGGSDLSAVVIGRSVVRFNTPSQYYVNVSNFGNDDAYLVPVQIFFPSSITVDPAFVPTEPPAAQGTISFPPSFSLDGITSVLQVLIPMLPSGQTIALPLNVTDPSAATFDIDVDVEDAYSVSITDFLSLANQAGTAALGRAGIAPESGGNPCHASNAAQDFLDCFNDVSPVPLTGACKDVLLNGSFAKDYLTLPAQYLQYIMGNKVNEAINGVPAGPPPSPSMLGPDGANNLMHDMAECLQELDLETEKTLADLLKCLGKKAAKNIPFPPSLPLCHGNGGGKGASGGSRCSGGGGASCGGGHGGGSIDPNDKAGPLGAGADQFVPATNPIQYVVSFENQPSATLAAQRVVITDQLDPAKIDLTTFALGPMGFGPSIVNPPPGSRNFTGTVNLGAVGSVSDLLVRIQGSLNSATGLIKWTFQSIDASTGMPPADPSVGFLPPDNKPPAGEGQVVFSVVPRVGLANGTPVSNQAAITFDQNDPLNTPVWSNALAEPLKQKLLLTPRSFNFPKTVTVDGNGGPSKPRNFVIINPHGAKGAQPVLVSNVLITGPFAAVNPTQCTNVLLKPGQKCVMRLVYTPSAAGKQSGSVKVFDNAAGSPQSVALSGTGIPATLKFKPAALAFKPQTVNTTSTPKPLTVTNASPLPIAITSVTPSTGFALSNDQCTGKTIAPKGTCTLQVTFTPTAKGPVKGTLGFVDDSVPQSVKLSGAGR